MTFNESGNTPLVRINSLSDALGVEILGKAEVGLSVCSRRNAMTESALYPVSESGR